MIGIAIIILQDMDHKVEAPVIDLYITDDTGGPPEISCAVDHQVEAPVIDVVIMNDTAGPPEIPCGVDHKVEAPVIDIDITDDTGGPPEISCGVDHEVEAPVIGRQWYSWMVGTDDDHVFRRQIAPARTFVPSLKVCTHVAAVWEEPLLET
jgi:hypothetical protein